MPRKLDITKAIQECKTVHNNKYDYSLSIVTKSTSKVKIVCPIHGVFEQRFDHHRRGSGCQKCRADKLRGSMTTSAQSFIDRSREIHGDKYGYSLSEYAGGKSKVKIVCPIHGVFEQRASNHLDGRGCQKCAVELVAGLKRADFGQFKTSAIALHGGRYEYPDQTYETGHTKVKIICPIHGEFFQTPANHLSGKGCASCGRYGFRDDTDAVLYVLRSNCSRYVKIGITGHLEQRIEQLQRGTPFEFKTAFTFSMPGKAARPMEAYAHEQFTNAGFTDFDGATEWQHVDEQALNHVVAMCG